MRVRSVMVTTLTSLLLLLSACSSIEGARHEYVMRGQVVEVTGKEVVVCVGSRDGVRVGQELQAYRLVATTTGTPTRNPLRWERQKVGVVRIVQVVDEHFARAQVISGDVAVNNLVELSRS